LHIDGRKYADTGFHLTEVKSLCERKFGYPLVTPLTPIV
jgi:hypothetical protein